MARFEGQVALVTGGASGLGRALCAALCRQGAIVIIADIDRPAAETLAARLSEAGHRAKPLGLDVGCPDAVAAAVDGVVAEFGRIDWLFNNAGIVVGGELQNIEVGAWRRIVEINFLGVVYGTRAAYRHMIRRRSGRIVNIASMYGLFPGIRALPYIATKHAVVGLSLSLRAEAKAWGVGVTAVCPGFIRTGLLHAGQYGQGYSAERMEGIIPFPFLDAETAAQAILRGVRSNKALVVFPLYARISWWLYRLSPGLLVLLNGLALRLQEARPRRGWRFLKPRS